MIFMQPFPRSDNYIHSGFKFSSFWQVLSRLQVIAILHCQKQNLTQLFKILKTAQWVQLFNLQYNTVTSFNCYNLWCKNQKSFGGTSSSTRVSLNGEGFPKETTLFRAHCLLLPAPGPLVPCWWPHDMKKNSSEEKPKLRNGGMAQFECSWWDRLK